MLSKEEAVELVEKALGSRAEQSVPLVVIESATIEKSFGWVFFYNSKKYIETKNIEFALAGNGPIICNKYTSEIRFFGSAKRSGAIIDEYENGLK